MRGVDERNRKRRGVVRIVTFYIKRLRGAAKEIYRASFQANLVAGR
jgi:hypothetical protein